MKKNTRLFHCRNNFSFGETLFVLCRQNAFRFNSVVAALIGIALMASPSKAYSQSADKKITFELTNQPLEKGIQQLEKASGFRFTYSTQQVAAYKSVSVEKGTRTLSSTLDLLLKSTKLSYKIQGQYVQIVAKGDARKQAAGNTESASQVSSVTGKITDTQGEALAGVNVRVKNSDKGVITDIDGN
jgi:hypothetical protein